MIPLEIVDPVAATGLFSYAWLMIALPALGALVLLAFGRFVDRAGPYLAVATITGSFVIAVALFMQLLAAPVENRAVGVHLYTWFGTGSWQVDVGLLVDQLSILFALLITCVGGLIHVYSLGYMAHDERMRRFFGYLNLFVAAMLTLVLADNYLVLFVGWEGVGLASYLLIGFWQHKPSAAAAAKKAFVMNRVGDLGMVLAISAMLAQFGSSAFVDVNHGAANLAGPWPMVIGLLLLLGACGKSAQVPLQAWLLDAMEGPTPVSALIHAATMVTAGVYLVVRSHTIFDLSPEARLAVVIVGTVTLLAGAWIGCSKDDIKKVLAGSTMSQIGYMMLAAGLGPAGYAFAIFHLLTHGAFKANMFLGAGSVMHGMNDDVDMRHYGGLWKYLPVTFWTFACGYLAIIGFPLTSGYFSKDHIIEAAFGESALVGTLALLGAGVTAFYMTRLMLMTFGGGKRWLDGVHPHESPAVMTVPLVVLAVLSIGAGAVMNWWIQDWLEPAAGNHPHEVELLPTPIGWLTMLVVAGGIGIGWLVFGRKPVPAVAPAGNAITVAGRNELYGNAVNDVLVANPVMVLSRGAVATDAKGVDGFVHLVSTAISGFSVEGRKAQTGYVRTYAVTMVLGVLVVGAVLILGLAA
ncbi:MAG: NADH-quinone oxidoreductase subunit L [Micropruina sp.]|nr:NADH-quinone oxidoreductase subunit L [Micropruina sp.]